MRPTLEDLMRAALKDGFQFRIQNAGDGVEVIVAAQGGSATYSVTRGGPAAKLEDLMHEAVALLKKDLQKR